MRFPPALLLLALTIAGAAMGCTVAPPNWGVGGPSLSQTSTSPDSSVIVVDGSVELRDGGTAEGAAERYLDASDELAP
jgi:hypothetical protein